VNLVGFLFIVAVSLFVNMVWLIKDVPNSLMADTNVSANVEYIAKYTIHRFSFLVSAINRLKAELNPICHFLGLLGDLTFMGPCIVSIFQYISNKMQRYTVYLYLETALHISGGTSTHHQERKQLYLQHLVFVTLLLLPAADSGR
jgi:hypothetical protein